MSAVCIIQSKIQVIITVLISEIIDVHFIFGFCKLSQSNVTLTGYGVLHTALFTLT